MADDRTPPTLALTRQRWWRRLRARPRLVLAALVGLAVYGLLPPNVASHPATRALVAWNAGAVLYVLLATLMMARSNEHRMRWRAQQQDDGQLVILVLAVVAAVVSLVAIAAELAAVKDMAHGWLRDLHIGLAGFTVLSSWAFVQVMFTLHYAHDYYAALARGAAGGLQFPGEAAPDYGDFFYFAAVIGTSGQTADVSFVSRHLRRVGTLHCLLAYLFNTTVLAMLVNIGAGLVT